MPAAKMGADAPALTGPEAITAGGAADRNPLDSSLKERLFANLVPALMRRLFKRSG